MRMKIRDNVQLKARHVELSEQMKELNLENAFMMINVINKRSFFRIYNYFSKKFYCEPIRYKKLR